MFNILVTGAGGGVGQGIIKSLKLIDDLAITIIAADMSELATGLYSADEACLVESCRSSSYLDSLANIFDKYSVDYYFPGTDIELRFCAEYKDIIKSKYGVHTVISSLETIEIADDKFKTYNFLKNNGFSHPKTEMLDQIMPENWTFPVIVKPAVGCRSIGVFKVNSMLDLEPHMKDPAGVVIQECVGTEDDEYTCTIVKCGNDISPVLALKRVLRAGDTFRAAPVKSVVIESYVKDVASKLGIDGGCNFQLRLDQNGLPKIFEINSRFSGTTPFCSQLGFNPVEFYLKSHLGINYNPNIDYDSVVMRYWSEAVISKRQVESLAFEKHLTPEVTKSVDMFLGRKV